MVIHKCLRVVFILEKLVQLLLEFSEGNCWVLTYVLFSCCCMYLVSRNWETIFILPFLMISGVSSLRSSSVIHVYHSFSFCQSENEITFLLWFAFLWILLVIYFLVAIAYACHRKLPAHRVLPPCPFRFATRITSVSQTLHCFFCRVPIYLWADWWAHGETDHPLVMLPAQGLTCLCM